jgi:hypothetical protein
MEASLSNGTWENSEEDMWKTESDGRFATKATQSGPTANRIEGEIRRALGFSPTMASLARHHCAPLRGWGGV